MIVMKVQQLVHAAGPSSRLALIAESLQQAILEQFVIFYTRLVREGSSGSSSLVLGTEDALLQIAFDLVYLGTAFSDAHPLAKKLRRSDAGSPSTQQQQEMLPLSVRQLLAAVEEKVDVVTWSTAFPLLAAAATNASAAAVLCFGLVGCCSSLNSVPAAMSPSFSMSEVDRFPLLPLSTPTPPKPNIAALLSSGTTGIGGEEKPPATATGASRSVKDAASLIAGATKGLRSVLWGES
jgi:hypothetical protein